MLGEWRVCHWYLGDDPITEQNWDASTFKLSNYITADKYHSRPWDEMDGPGDFFTTFHDSLALGNKTYHNVVQVRISSNWEVAPWLYQTWFVRGIGPIYREFYDGSRWQLIRHGTF